MFSQLKRVKSAPIFFGLLLLLAHPMWAQYKEGDRVGDFTLTDVDGDSVSLFDFKGKVILLTFFETGCPSCDIDAPSIEKNIWQVFQSRGLQVLGINLGESASKIKTWKEEHELTYPVLIDKTTYVWGRYSLGAYPQNVVLDTSLVVRYTNYGYEESMVKATINKWLPVTTEISGDPTGKNPHAFSLYQNYPNPFNPSTTIGYEIPDERYIDLKISDLLGREVRSLVSGERSAGFHQAIWDGLDDRGLRVTTGIYFYTLKSGGFSATRQLYLLK